MKSFNLLKTEYDLNKSVAQTSGIPRLVVLKSREPTKQPKFFTVPGGEHFLHEPTVTVRATKENITVDGKTYTASSAWIYRYDSAEASIKDNLSTTKGYRYRDTRVRTECYGTITVSEADPAEYPHKCPRCQAPAYIGLSSVDCFKKCQ